MSEVGRQRIAVIGAGAIGGTIAARLSAAGEDVTLVARRARRTFLMAGGIRIEDPDRVLVARPRIVSPADASPYDILFIAVKSQYLADLSPTIAAMMHQNTLVVPLCNGIPWWYGAGEGLPSIGSIDPEGRLGRAIPAPQTVGTVVFLRCSLKEEGHIFSQGSERIVLGAPVERVAEGVGRVASLLRHAGLLIDIASDIRREMWAKLALNLATNPLSVVTGVTLHTLFHDPALSPVVRDIVDEVLWLAEACGRRPDASSEALMEIGRRAGPFMTSMAQDFARGRSLELTAIADAPFELAAWQRVGMPVSQAIVHLARHAERRQMAG